MSDSHLADSLIDSHLADSRETEVSEVVSEKKRPRRGKKRKSPYAVPPPSTPPPPPPPPSPTTCVKEELEEGECSEEDATRPQKETPNLKKIAQGIDVKKTAEIVVDLENYFVRGLEALKMVKSKKRTSDQWFALEHAVVSPLFYRLIRHISDWCSPDLQDSASSGRFAVHRRAFNHFKEGPFGYL